MELIKSINDVKGNIRLGQINDIEIYNSQKFSEYKFLEDHIKYSFFGLIKKKIKAGWFLNKTRVDLNLDTKYNIIIDGIIHKRPLVIFSFIATDQKATFTFDNNKQAAKFVREITKLLVIKQEWLKLI